MTLALSRNWRSIKNHTLCPNVRLMQFWEWVKIWWCLPIHHLLWDQLWRGSTVSILFCRKWWNISGILDVLLVVTVSEVLLFFLPELTLSPSSSRLRPAIVPCLLFFRFAAKSCNSSRSSAVKSSMMPTRSGSGSGVRSIICSCFSASRSVSVFVTTN